MKTANTTVIIIILTTTLFFQLCHGQAVVEFPEEKISRNNTIPTPVPKLTALLAAQPSVTSSELKMCHNDDKFSNAYCRCNEKVVSCDFSTYTNKTVNVSKGGHDGGDTNTTNHMESSIDHLELTLDGSQLPTTTSRVCFCNAPANLHLNFAMPKFLPFITNKIQRFDLFNLSGITHFNGGFNVNFQGDLYIANVSHIPEIHAFEFGRGNDEPIANVQDLECCSPIKVNQLHQKPLLFIENSTIDVIRSKGIGDDHLWKTLIFKSDIFNKIEQYGIKFDSVVDLNVAILGGKFKNVSHHAMLFQDAGTVFLTKNTFLYSDGVESFSFGSRSKLNHSIVMLLANEFQNEMYLSLDARHVISWYNIFDLWDPVTFSSMNTTSFSSTAFQNSNGNVAPDRSVSFKDNIVFWVSLPNKSIDFGSDTITTLSGNVLGSCSCSKFQNISDEALKPEINWCYVGSVIKLNGNCSLRLDAALKKCSSSNSVDFNEFCTDKTIAVPRLPGNGANLTQDVYTMKINSSFITTIVDDFHAMFGVNRIKKLKGLLNVTETSNTAPDQNDENSEAASTSANSNKHGSTGKGVPAKHSPVVSVIVTIGVVIVVVVMGIFFYRYRHKIFNRSGHHTLDEDNRNEMT